MSHQVGLVWQGGNGWDDLVRLQLEECTIRQRLGGRRDSAAQISTPPSTSPPPGKTSSKVKLVTESNNCVMQDYSVVDVVHWLN